jgi:hypothetical protein
MHAELNPYFVQGRQAERLEAAARHHLISQAKKAAAEARSPRRPFAHLWVRIRHLRSGRLHVQAPPVEPAPYRFTS